uniref:Uncharacterized protein n=1 Tax=Amphimedon queenslandica TaxID=400682 RepID=A0A1X7T213_AMPQE
MSFHPPPPLVGLTVLDWTQDQV